MRRRRVVVESLEVSNVYTAATYNCGVCWQQREELAQRRAMKPVFVCAVNSHRRREGCLGTPCIVEMT